MHIYPLMHAYAMTLLDCLSLPQTSTSPPVFGEAQVPHPSGTRLQPAHHAGTAQQGQSTYQGVVF